jgi:hypothetical protein
MLKPPAIKKPCKSHVYSAERASGQRKYLSALGNVSLSPCLNRLISVSDDRRPTRKPRHTSLIPCCVPESIAQANGTSAKANGDSDPNAKVHTNQQDVQTPLESTSECKQNELQGNLPDQDGLKVSSGKVRTNTAFHNPLGITKLARVDSVRREGQRAKQYQACVV